MSKVHVKTGDTVVLLTGKDIYQYKDVTDKSRADSKARSLLSARRKARLS